MENKSLNEIKPREIKISLPVVEKTAGGNKFTRILPTIITTIFTICLVYSDLISYSVGDIETSMFITLIILSCIIFILGLIYLVLSILFSKTTTKIKIKENSHKYDKYLKKEEIKFEKIIEEEKKELNDRYITNKNDDKYLYRNIKSNLFTSISLGIGNVEVNNRIIFDTTLYNDDETMMNKVSKLIDKYKTLHDVPYPLNIRNKKAIAIVNNTNSYQKYINYILFQLIKYHDSNELKLIVLTNDDNSFSELEKSAFTIDSTYLYAKNLKEAKDVMKKCIKSKNSYYLIITNDYKNYKELIMDYLFKFENLGLLVFDKSITNISIDIKTIIMIDDGRGSITTVDDTTLNEDKFIPILFDKK